MKPRSVALIKKSASLSRTNIKLLKRYHTTYSIPYYHGDFMYLQHKIIEGDALKMVETFSPFLRKHGVTKTVNEIAVYTLTSIAQSIMLYNENKTLAWYIEYLENCTNEKVHCQVVNHIYIDVCFVPSYLLYIQLYGVPENGIFDPTLLSQLSEPCHFC